MLVSCTSYYGTIVYTLSIYKVTIQLARLASAARGATC